ncbi:MAG: S41 family peptidase, partial [Bacteroidota bacterium]
MPNKIMIYILFLLSSLSTACSQEIPFNAALVFDEFWTFTDENYIFFKEKNINWDSVYTLYRQQISGATTEDELFSIMGEAILALKDNHSGIYRPDEYGPFFDYQAGYEIYFDPELVKEQYVQDSLGQSGQLYWGLINPKVGYIYWPKFQSYAGFGDILRALKDRGIQKLIIDVRGNGGGD